MKKVHHSYICITKENIEEYCGGLIAPKIEQIFVMNIYEHNIKQQLPWDLVGHGIKWSCIENLQLLLAKHYNVRLNSQLDMEFSKIVGLYCERSQIK